MKKFDVGDVVFLCDFFDKKVTPEKIVGVDIIDNHPLYCLKNHFGYFTTVVLFKTSEEALNKLHELKVKHGLT